MENQFNGHESAEAEALWTANDDAGDRLNAIKKEAGEVGAEIAGKSIDEVIAGVIAEGKLFHVKTGKFMTDNRNLIGAALGVGIGVGLELLSPTGSKTSALVSGLAGGAVLAVVAPVLKVAPQATGIAAAAGTLTSFVSMSAGRITADYFPGNLGNDE
jgi:hypothetical protein